MRGAFQRRQAAFQRGACRVAGARVFVTFVLADALLHEGRGLIDWRHDGAGSRVRRLPGVDGERFDMVAPSHDYSVASAATVVG